MRGIVLLLVLLASGCRPQWPGDPDVYGADVVVMPQAGAFTQAADFRPRLREVLAKTARWFGREPEEFAGLRIIIDRGPVCAPASASSWVSGCYDGWDNTVTVSNAMSLEPAVCVENLALPHELFHYLLDGDPDHTDPRWRTVLQLMKSIGYGRC